MKLTTQKFNGCAHDIIIYGNADYRNGRNGGYYLINEDSSPIEIIRQNKALNVRENPYIIQMQGTPILVPEVGTDQLDIPNRYTDYSLIVVSQKYAELCRRVQWYGIPQLAWFGEYADRLYTPVWLKDANQKICGCIGLKKVLPPKYPQEYVQNIRAGQFKPSYHAVKMCVEKFRAYAASDINLQIAIRELEAAIYETESANKTSFATR